MSLLPEGYPNDARAALAILNARERLGIDDLKVLALIELSGESAYFALGQAAGNDEARALLERNGQEERGHAHRLLKAISLLGGSFELPTPEANPFYRPPVKMDGLGENMLKGMEMAEMDGDVHYKAWADAEPNPDVAKIYRQNASEEWRHAERVAQVKALLQ